MVAMRKIAREEILRRLAQLNPWWDKPHAVPEMYSRCRPRSYLPHFLALLGATEIRRAVVLMGPRRVGKTFMLHHAIQELLRRGTNPRDIMYVSVEHPVFNGLSLDQILELFVEATARGSLSGTGTSYVFFDEIQYLRDWELHLKALVDTNPHVRAASSGSSAAALRLKSVESGAGRFSDMMLPPLTFQEFLMLLDKERLLQEPTEGDQGIWPAVDIEALNEEFVHYLNFGGYPEVVLSEVIQRAPEQFIRADIIEKVLLRDLPSLYGIQDIPELNSLFTTLAYNTANEISLDELSKQSGVAKNTIKRYIGYLEAAFLVRVVHRVDRAGKRFERQNFFKIYLTNPSIRAALFAPVAEGDDSMGSLVETAVFAQWFHSDVQLHYARWHNGEVDIVNLGQSLRPQWAVEAKWSDRIVEHPEELVSLTGFCAANGLSAATVTTKTRVETQPYRGVTIEYRPASTYCYTVGRNLVAHWLDRKGAKVLK